MLQDELDRNLALLVAVRMSLRQFSIRLYDTDDTREEQIRGRVDECFEAVSRLRDYLEARPTKQLAYNIDNGRGDDA